MGMDTLLTEIAGELETKVTQNIETKVTQNFDKKLDELNTKLDDAITGADLHVKIATKDSTKVGGLKHSKLTDLITISANKLPVLLVGMAGTGKTHAAEQVSEALNIDFYAMSVGAQTSKSDLMGFIHAGGQYIPSMFRKAFEFGGVFLLDEIDAGNSNVLVQLNAALSNGYCAFPDKMVAKHEDFVFIASANTYGQGASRQYVGRNQLDAATLDRFVILDWDIDNRLEGKLAGDNKQWLETVRAIRKYVESEGIRALVTPRATIKGAQMLGAGLSFDDTLSAVVLGGISADKQTHIKKIAKTTWDANKPKKGEKVAYDEALLLDALLEKDIPAQPKMFISGDMVRITKRKLEYDRDTLDNRTDGLRWDSSMDKYNGFTGRIQQVKIDESTPWQVSYTLEGAGGYSFHRDWLDYVGN